MTTLPVKVRIAFRPYWTFISLEAALGFTLVLFVIDGTKIEWPLYWAILAGMTVLSAIGTWAMQLFYVVRVTNTEIKGFDSLCLPKTFLWEEVSKIKPLNLLGIKCLLIYSKRHFWALWFPLQISNGSSTRNNLAQLDEIPRQLLNYLK